MIDAAIFGKPVLTVELPELAFGQAGTIHFEYLSTVAGGLLRSAESLEEHVQHLAEEIHRDPYARDARSTRFVEAFVRPQGLDVPAADVFSTEMLRLLGRPPSAPVPGLAAMQAGRILRMVAPPLLGGLFEDQSRFRLWLARRRKERVKRAKARAGARKRR